MQKDSPAFVQCVSLSNFYRAALATAYVHYVCDQFNNDVSSVYTADAHVPFKCLSCMLPSLPCWLLSTRVCNFPLHMWVAIYSNYMCQFLLVKLRNKYFFMLMFPEHSDPLSILGKIMCVNLEKGSENS